MSDITILPHIDKLLAVFVEERSEDLEVKLAFRPTISPPKQLYMPEGYAEDVEYRVGYIYKDKERHIAGFRLTLLPGNASIVIVSGCWVDYKYRKRGIGGELHKLRLDALKSAGVRMVVCTVNCCNAAEIHIMEKFGWVRAGMFDSTLGYGSTAMYTKVL